MRRHPAPLTLTAALLLPLALSGCAFGAYFPPTTSLERQISGVYEGVGVGPTGRVPYRLTLGLVERDGRASGSLVNLESRKVYAGSGPFKRLVDGTELTLKLYENGAHRANLYLVRHDKDGTVTLNGHLRTVLLGREALGYTLQLRPIPPAQP
ncbi:hypothetical protein CBQ26_13275 [Deinococcus indicus]|uniref:Uncharacterized protein n=1 Tax=Deinococcus indicus TaxID=223556 RepID=A0A246BIE9_9DEIO|nr:hypothetical protein [Deinococcus indicus]OWL95020.1 hypothetical protein CBQ26_13275 [Deinococcus indicus]GHG20347.1 hypothetical protein GCM10017784_09690 [Deinococcus indicus]